MTKLLTHNYKMIISKKESNIIKGCAITFIILHNFLHVSTWGFSSENEMSFSFEKSMHFFRGVYYAPENILYELFSFVGWIGVAFFVFISGYGLTQKYSKNEILNPQRYVKCHFLKLFLLLLPGALFYALLSYFAGDMNRVIGSVLSLSLLNNFTYLYFPFQPGSYWYFGLAFQLYIVYLLIYKSSNNLLWCMLIASIFLQATTVLFSNGSVMLGWFRHNFIGWLPVFVFGILASRGKFKIKINKWPSIVVLILSFLLIFICLLMNLNFFIWLFLPFMAILFFYIFGIIIQKNKYSNSIFLWIGKYSSCIFLIHPIARTLISKQPIAFSLPVQIILYVAITFILARAYMLLYDFLKRKLIKGF